MSDYIAPTKDMQFVINELANLSEINRIPVFEDATEDLVEAVLEQAGIFASEVFSPLNQAGMNTALLSKTRSSSAHRVLPRLTSNLSKMAGRALANLWNSMDRTCRFWSIPRRQKCGTRRICRWLCVLC